MKWPKSQEQGRRHQGCLGSQAPPGLPNTLFGCSKFRSILTFSLWCPPSQTLHWFPHVRLFSPLAPALNSLSFFPVFQCFRERAYHSPEIIVCCLERSRQKFYRLELRLRAQSKQSTPTGSNSRLESDSAALHSCAMLLFKPYETALQGKDNISADLGVRHQGY